MFNYCGDEVVTDDSVSKDDCVLVDNFKIVKFSDNVFYCVLDYVLNSSGLGYGLESMEQCLNADGLYFMHGEKHFSNKST